MVNCQAHGQELVRPYWQHVTVPLRARTISRAISRLSESSLTPLSRLKKKKKKKFVLASILTLGVSKPSVQYFLLSKFFFIDIHQKCPLKMTSIVLSWVCREGREKVDSFETTRCYIFYLQGEGQQKPVGTLMGSYCNIRCFGNRKLYGFCQLFISMVNNCWDFFVLCIWLRHPTHLLMAI